MSLMRSNGEMRSAMALPSCAWDWWGRLPDQHAYLAAPDTLPRRPSLFIFTCGTGAEDNPYGCAVSRSKAEVLPVTHMAVSGVRGLVAPLYPMTQNGLSAGEVERATTNQP